MEKCEHCGWEKGRGTVQVLGGGGDYETWPCPVCRPKEHADCVRESYSPGCYDGEGD
jgi:hypothetical protein